MPGQYCFPFELDVPEWLPASTMCYEKKNSTTLVVRYAVVAQLTPVYAKDYIEDPTQGISNFRSERVLIVYNDLMRSRPNQNYNLTFKMTQKVGGMKLLGFFQTKT